MQNHNLKRKTPNKKSALIGRGGKRGKTSGKGGKGQTARAGAKVRPEIRDTIKRLPKLRGRGKNSFLSIQTKPIAVYLDQLSVFKAGEKVTPKTLVDKGVTEIYKGRYPAIKILSNGDIETKLVISGCTVSAGAKVKIEAAGGSVK
ncbi:MAG: uL15m family ribosomal protein [Patescibacteria group bacterium]